MKLEEKKRVSLAQRAVDTWNEKHSIGTHVLVRPIILEAPRWKSRTRSAAWMMGGHHASVMIEGKAGGYSLSALDVVTAEEWSASKLPLAGTPPTCVLVHEDGRREEGTEESVRANADNIIRGKCRVTFEEVTSG